MAELQRVTLDGPHQVVAYFDPAADRPKTVLFLHGWGVSAVAFAEFFECLAPSFRVVAPDLPGFGGSTPLARTSYADYADFCARFADALDLGPVHLIGASMGGGIAMKFASTHPHRVRSITLIGPTGCPGAPFLRLAVNRVTEVVRQVVHPRFVHGKGPVILSFVRNLVRAPGAMAATVRMLSRESVLDGAPTVDVPTLLLWGERDQTIPVALADRFARHCPQATLEVVPGAFHEVTTSEPKLVARIVKDFLARVDSKA